MTRRWPGDAPLPRPGVVLLTVLALAIYLITPDRLPAAPQPHPPAGAGEQSRPAGSAHDLAAHPGLTSDGVTTLTRAAAPPAGAETALLPVAAHRPAHQTSRRPPARQTAAARPPDLHALQILRC